MKISTLMKTLVISAAILATSSTTTQAQTADQDTIVVVPETGILPIKPSRNFTGDKGLIVCSLYGTSNATSTGLSFTKFALSEVVVGSSTNSSSGLFLLAKPGTYHLTLTDDAVTGNIFSTSVSWQAEAGKAYKKDRVLYKFVNKPGRIGFERDENYAADKYQYCDMAEEEHVYVPLASGNLTIIARLLDTTPDALSFIPWDGPWRNVPTAADVEAAGITTLRGEATASPSAFDLQGRRVAQPAKGLYIVNGKKYLKP